MYIIYTHICILLYPPMYYLYSLLVWQYMYVMYK